MELQEDTIKFIKKYCRVSIDSFDDLILSLADAGIEDMASYGIVFDEKSAKHMLVLSAFVFSRFSANEKIINAQTKFYSASIFRMKNQKKQPKSEVMISD